MTVVSSKEFASHQDKYFEIAMEEQVYIKRGKDVFHLIYTTDNCNMNETDDQDDEYITKDELLSGIYEDIDNFYTNK